MSDGEALATRTNDTPDHEEQIVVGCDLLWSYAQRFSYQRLSDQQPDGSYRLIGLYAGRARRIAATYARFYLEKEEGGDPSKLGRYYWMALGAFASKTVACLLDSWQVEGAYFAGWVTRGTFDAQAIANGLAKGNLWLFGDIAPAHWFYNRYPQNFFEGMGCIHRRNANSLVEPVRTHVNRLPWSAESLPKVNDFRASSELIRGFELVAQIEGMPATATLRKNVQMEHLVAIAEHEQGEVLQPLIYEDPNFSRWTEAQRAWYLRPLSPAYELVFSHQCSQRDNELISKAPRDMVVEDFSSRMDWIQKAAEKFHDLMSERADYMLRELNTMAGWVRSPDARWIY